MDLIMGDEFTPGANRHSIDLRPVSSIMTEALGTRTIVSAVKGALITGKGRLTLSHQLKQFSFAAYDRVFLFYGLNDYLHSPVKLSAVDQKLTSDLRTLRRQNRWLHIYGILPFPIYDSNGHSLARKRGAGAYTLHDLVKMLSLSYANNEVPALNWSLLANPVINQHNYRKRLKDGKYPTSATVRLMASRLARFARRADRVPKFKAQNPMSDHSAKVVFFGKPASNQSASQSNSTSDIEVRSESSK